MKILMLPQILIPKFTCKLPKIASNVFKNKNRDKPYFMSIFFKHLLLDVFRLTHDMYLGRGGMKHEL